VVKKKGRIHGLTEKMARKENVKTQTPQAVEG
jgi:hypothetical protein